MLDALNSWSSEIAAKMVEDHFRLLIVDSITALFRVDFSGRGELAERQQRLGGMMSRLTKIAEEFNIAILISNQGSISFIQAHRDSCV